MNIPLSVYILALFNALHLERGVLYEPPQLRKVESNALLTILLGDKERL
jgi:hypothetical protein